MSFILPHPARVLWQLACGLLCLHAAPCIHASEPTNDLEELFRSANDRLDAFDFAGAIDGYNQILEAMPEADNVWINRALAKWKLRDVSGARADLAQAIKLNPENPEAYRMRAGIRNESRDYAAALADMDQALRYAPDEPWYLASRGEIRIALEQHDGALDDLDRAIELDGEFVEAIYLRAGLLQRRNESDAAIAGYTRVVELAPGHADAYYNRAWLRFHDLDWTGAIADGARVLELAPDTAVAVRLVGYATFAQGRFEEAAGVLARAEGLARADGSHGMYPLLIRHIALQRIGAPDTKLAEACAQDSGDPWARALAEFLLGARSEDDLETLASEPEDAYTRGERQCEAHFYIGVARALAGDRSTARLRFRAALATDRNTFVEYALARAELDRL